MHVCMYACIHECMQGVFYCNFGRPLQCSSSALLCWLHQCSSERRSKENLREKGGIKEMLTLFEVAEFLFQTYGKRVSIWGSSCWLVWSGETGREGRGRGREGGEGTREGGRSVCQPVRTPGRHFSLSHFQISTQYFLWGDITCQSSPLCTHIEFPAWPSPLKLQSRWKVMITNGHLCILCSVHLS